MIKHKNDEQLTKNLHRDIQQFSQIPIKVDFSHPSCLSWMIFSQLIFISLCVWRLLDTIQLYVTCISILTIVLFTKQLYIQ